MRGGPPDDRDVRAARGVRSRSTCSEHASGAGLALAGDRPLEGRARRPAADRQSGRPRTLTFGTEEWLVSEIFADRGETVVLEPAALRPRDREAGQGARARARREPHPRPQRHPQLDRQHEREGRASAGRRVELHGAAVRLGDRPRDVEPEARSGAVSGLLERLEDPLAVGGRDAGPAVANANPEGAVTALRAPLRPRRRAARP